MSGTVLAPTRKDSARGVWRNPSIDAGLKLNVDPLKLKERVNSPAETHNAVSKLHNKFFRLTKRLLHSNNSSPTSTTAASAYISNGRDAGSTRSKDDAASGARSLRDPSALMLPIYTSSPHKLGEYTRLSSYDRARAEAVSLTYANPRMMDAKHSGKVPTGSFQLEQPLKSTRLTIVLDLDETLVHTIADHTCCSVGADGRKLVHHTENRQHPKQTMTVFYRPFVVSFLRALKKMRCEIILFTAGTQAYTDAVLDVLDPYHELIDHRLYRQHVSGHPLRCNVLCKNLDLLGRDLNHCLIIDDTPDTFCLQPANGWAISPYGKKLIYSNIGSILFKGSEEDYRRFCAPAILERRNIGHSSGLASSKLVVGCAREDYALLNAICLVKEFFKSGMSIPKFTLFYEKQIRAALLSNSDSLFCP